MLGWQGCVPHRLYHGGRCRDISPSRARDILSTSHITNVATLFHNCTHMLKLHRQALVSHFLRSRAVLNRVLRLSRVASVRISLRSLSTQTPLAPLIADAILPKCSSCGVLLQNEDRLKPGYYINPGTSQEFRKTSDSVYEKHLAALDEPDRLLLLNGASTSLAAKERKQNRKSDPSKILCVRCRDSQYRSQFKLDQFAVASVAEVMHSIPAYAQLIYVVSATDFPMSINEEVFRMASAKEMHFVVTKNDLFFAKNSVASKYGLQFYQDYFWRMYQVPPANVHCVSGKSDWNTEQLLDTLRDNLYFIGSVNSGKSTLIQSLVHLAHKRREAMPNSKRTRLLQKSDDRAISLIEAPKTRLAQIKQKLAAATSYKAKNGPGASYMPGFTRGNLPFVLSRKVTIYDVPGFSNVQTGQLYDFLPPQAIKALHRGQKMFKAGTYKSHYETAKSGQVLTVGGLFWLQIPQNTMFRVKNLIGHQPHVFKDFAKALDVWHHPEKYPALKDVLLVPPTRDGAPTPLVKYIIPSFYGSIDFVLRYLGYISLTPTGAKHPDAGPLVVYLPPEVDAIIRQPITQYITRTLSGRDANGNVLKKENWVQKSVTEVKRYSGKTPFTSRLIPVVGNDTATDEAAFMHQYVEKIKGQAVPHGQITEETKYANWL